MVSLWVGSRVAVGLPGGPLVRARCAAAALPMWYAHAVRGRLSPVVCARFVGTALLARRILPVAFATSDTPDHIPGRGCAGCRLG